MAYERCSIESDIYVFRWQYWEIHISNQIDCEKLGVRRVTVMTSLSRLKEYILHLQSLGIRIGRIMDRIDREIESGIYDDFEPGKDYEYKSD